MKVALYTRVSTQEQANEGYSIGEQSERLKSYCKAMNWHISNIYSDPGYSGANMDRPALQSLIDAVKNKEVDRVVVYKLDRLSRSQLDTLYLIEKVFLKNGIDFVSMLENFDTSTPFGRAMVGILAVFAQLEREQIKERSKMGKDARAKNGKWGGGQTPIGYDYDPIKETLVINEFEAMQVRELFKMYNNGTRIRTIERVLREKGYKHKYGVWTIRTISRIINHRVYLGELLHHNKYLPGLHEPIIDKDTFTKAQEITAIRKENNKNKYKPTGKRNSYLGGILKCGRCGAGYVRQPGTPRKDGTTLKYYMCYSRCKKTLSMIIDPNCKNDNWRSDKIESIVFDELRKLAIDPNLFDEISNNSNEVETLEQIEIINKEILSIDEQINKLMDLYSLGKLDIKIIDNKISGLTTRRNCLENEINSLSSNSKETIKKEAKDAIASINDILERNNFDEIRLLIDTLISEIIVDGDNIEIHWRFA